MKYRLPHIPPVDQVGIEQRAKRLAGRSIKKEAKKQVLELIISMCDLTTLEGMDTVGKVQKLCQKAKQPMVGYDLPSVAAVCVYPSMVKTAVEAVRGTKIHVASVATGFPSGQTFTDLRLEEVRETVEAGAHEIDMVINRGAFLAGDYDTVYQEIKAVKKACKRAHLKVILETGELKTHDNVRKASIIAIDAGADFIKTSTGKVQPAATLPVTLNMLEAIRDHYLKTGKMVGMKPAGGIRTSKQAWAYLVMVKETLGDAWLTPKLFRFGASSLLNDVLMQWKKLETGRYQSTRYFSVD